MNKYVIIVVNIESDAWFEVTLPWKLAGTTSLLPPPVDVRLRPSDQWRPLVELTPQDREPGFRSVEQRLLHSSSLLKSQHGSASSEDPSRVTSDITSCCRSALLLLRP